jgi:hypothetical protein
MILKRILGPLLGLAMISAGAPCAAQSSPGFVLGQVPTVAQWNGYFAAKQDYNPAFFGGSYTWTGSQTFTGSLAFTGPQFFTGEITTPAASSVTAGFNLPHGVAPTSPVNGDLWTTPAGLFARINTATHTLAYADLSNLTAALGITSGGTGATTAPAALTNLGAAPLAGATFTGEVVTPASAIGTAGLNVPPGAAPTSPVNGDVWTTTAGLYVRINGTTVGPLVANPLAYTLISTLTASNSAALTWSSLPTNYTDLRLIINGTVCVSSSVQSLSYTDTNAATVTGQSMSSGGASTSAEYGIISIPSWQDHSFFSLGAYSPSARPTGVTGSAGGFNTAGTLASISLVCNTGNISSGTASLYGR